METSFILCTISSVFILNLSMSVVDSSSLVAAKTHCNATVLELYGARNSKLQAYTYEQTSASSLVVCGRNCHLDSRCKSFTYHECSRACELKNGSRAENSDSLVAIPGGFYFDSSQDTALLSVEFPDDRYCSCKKLLEAGHSKSGVYTIYPAAYSDGLDVYCDMDTDDGGWIVIQRRQDGSEDFYRNWTEYESGFGNLSGEFWLGNKAIQDLTKFGGPWVIRIDMEDFHGDKPWAEYFGFQLLGGSYKLSYDNFNLESPAGDSLFSNRNRPFQTKDSYDIGYNCPSHCHGAWWYGLCSEANLNGLYQPKHQDPFKPSEATYWKSWKDTRYWSVFGLSRCSMKISEI